MGWTHFLTKRLPKVATEMALNVLAYNMKRVMAIIGVAGLLEALALGLDLPSSFYWHADEVIELRNLATQKVWTADDRLGSKCEILTVSILRLLYPRNRTQLGLSLMS